MPSSAAYGMTETSPTVSHVVKGTGKHESVGVPVPNTEMTVVHPETRSSLAARQTGEICVRGPQVREGFIICCFPYLALASSFYVTIVVPLPVGSLIVLTSPPQHRPYAGRNNGGKLIVGVVR